MRVRRDTGEQRATWFGRIGIRWLLLGVGVTGLALPVLALFLIDAFNLYLVQETERNLLGQAAIVSQVYRSVWAEQSNTQLGDPRPPTRQHQRYAPYRESIQSLRHLESPLPRPFPTAKSVDPAAARAGQRLQVMLEDSLVFHLTGIRLLDTQGTVIASSQPAVGFSMAMLPEVKRALGGTYSAVLRERVSDEPDPTLGSLSRRGKRRVFSAQPVWNDGKVVGVVTQSRTAETSTEWLWKQRRGLVFGGATLMLAALLVSFGFARTIERPLRSMSRAAEAIAEGRDPARELLFEGGPREVQLLGRSLDAMAQQIRRRNQYITEFVSTVGHELKSPLTSIAGASELLSEQWSEIPDAQRQRFLANIQAAASRTTALVQRLLRLARAENPARTATPESIDLEAVRVQLLERYPDHVQADIKGRSARVVGYPEDLECVLGNLLDNALRYRRSMPVRVTLQPLPSGKLEICVENDGPAISPANQARLFTRFFTTERDSGGTGLGLSIVKAIAEAHGGSATVTSDDVSTRFRVVI